MKGAPDFLLKIIRHKAEELVERSTRVPLRMLNARLESASPARGFVEALEKPLAIGNPAIVAEIKKASPSKGLLREDFDPATLAKGYETAGAHLRCELPPARPSPSVPRER